MFLPLYQSFRRYSIKQNSFFHHCNRKKGVIVRRKIESDNKVRSRDTVSHESRFPLLDYENLDPCTGKSIVQQRFDALSFAALLRYGPAPPAHVYENFCSLPHSKLILACDIDKERKLKVTDLYRKDASIVFQDEVRLKIPELLCCLRKENPAFSLKYDSGGVPFSLLIKNCLYFQAFNGYACYMRIAKLLHRQVSSEKDTLGRMKNTSSFDPNFQRASQDGFHRLSPDNEDRDGCFFVRKSKDFMKPCLTDCSESADISYIVLSLDKYKYKEPTSSDGVRCGPQPWLYSFRQM